MLSRLGARANQRDWRRTRSGSSSGGGGGGGGWGGGGGAGGGGGGGGGDEGFGAEGVPGEEGVEGGEAGGCDGEEVGGDGGVERGGEEGEDGPPPACGPDELTPDATGRPTALREAARWTTTAPPPRSRTRCVTTWGRAPGVARRARTTWSCTGGR